MFGTLLQTHWLRFSPVVFLLMSLAATQVHADNKVDAALMQLLKMESGSLPKADQVLPGKNPKGLYRVRVGDNLDSIINRFYGDSAIQHGILKAAFVKGNPQSFRRGNAN